MMVLLLQTKRWWWRLVPHRCLLVGGVLWTHSRFCLSKLSKHSKLPTRKTTTKTVVYILLLLPYCKPCLLLESPFWECLDLTLGRFWIWCTIDDPQKNTNKCLNMGWGGWLGRGYDVRRFRNPGIAKIGLTPHPPILAHWWISRQKVRKCDSRQSIKSA